jgi:ATP-dependent Clp protease ATP-binding subunit ClpA
MKILQKIVGLQLKSVTKNASRHHYGRLRGYCLFLKGYDPQFGARPVKRVDSKGYTQ